MKKTKLSTYILVGALALSAGLLLFGGGNGSGSFSSYGNLGGVALGGGDGGELGLAPDFTLNTLTGKALALSAYRDKKPVILDFFATWCHNCQRNIPKEVVLYEKYKDRLEVIGVNLREDPVIVKSFAEKNKVTFPVVLDRGGLAANLYGVRYTNFKVLINKDGSLARFIPGDIGESDFLSLLESQ